MYLLCLTAFLVCSRKESYQSVNIQFSDMLVSVV